MKIGDFPVVEAMVDARSRLNDWISKGRISIDIDGGRMSADFVEAVEPAIKLEIRRRIQDLDERLLLLGVEID